MSGTSRAYGAREEVFTQASRWMLTQAITTKTYGWLGWAHDGQEAGTTGLSKRAEAIDIQILPKGAPAPGNTHNAFRSR